MALPVEAIKAVKSRMSERAGELSQTDRLMGIPNKKLV